MRSAFEYVVENPESSLAVFHRQYLERNNRRKIAGKKQSNPQIFLLPPPPKVNKYPSKIGPSMDFATVLRHVLLKRGIDEKIFFSRSQKRIVAGARGYFYWLCKTYLKRSLFQIGKYVGRDHSTIINGITRYCIETGERYPSKSGRIPRNKSNYELTIYATEKAIEAADLIKSGKTPLEAAEKLGVSRVLIYHRVAYAVKKGILPRRLSSERYGLTDKQERFVHEYLKHGNKITAFKAVYSYRNLGPVNLIKRINEVMGCKVVIDRIAALCSKQTKTGT